MRSLDLSKAKAGTTQRRKKQANHQIPSIMWYRLLNYGASLDTRGKNPRNQR
jgi:hypothetical protein